MRIIAGTLKGRRLQAPPLPDTRVRPTADRAREALFSILQRWPQGPFLDLFAGTGAVAVEARSRGYGPVACVERDPAALACARANTRGTAVQVAARDALRLPADAYPGQMVIFADPPYEQSLACWQALAGRLASWLDPDGVLVWETAAGTPLPPAPGLAELEARRYGAAEFHLLRTEPAP